MKKNLTTILSALVVSLAFSCTSSSTEPALQETKTQESNMKEAENGQKLVYTCPMHPEVTSDTEGTCPKCGMKLEVKK